MDTERKHRLLEQYKLLCHLRYECGGIEDTYPADWVRATMTLDQAVVRGAQIMAENPEKFYPGTFDTWVELYDSVIVKIMERHHEP